MKHYNKNYEEMILRDFLALDRTKLANERTLLSYLRTFLGFLASGIGLLKLTDDCIFIFIGIVLSVISPLFLVIGIYRFFKLRKEMKELDL